MYGHNSAIGAHRWPVNSVSSESGNLAFNDASAGSSRITSPNRAKRIARIFTRLRNDQAARLLRLWIAERVADPVQIPAAPRSDAGIGLSSVGYKVHYIDGFGGLQDRMIAGNVRSHELLDTFLDPLIERDTHGPLGQGFVVNTAGKRSHGCSHSLVHFDDVVIDQPGRSHPFFDDRPIDHVENVMEPVDKRVVVLSNFA